MFFGASLQRRPPSSVFASIKSGDLRVVPLVAMDFSMGNVHIGNFEFLHHDGSKQPNDYLEITAMISDCYSNVTNIPIFGYGAKTSSYSPNSAPLFPITRRIRNPLVPNDPLVLRQMYFECLNSIEMSEPCNLNEIIKFVKQLGMHVKSQLIKKAKSRPEVRLTIDAFYVMYVLSSGLIDDLEECLVSFKETDWS